MKFVSVGTKNIFFFRSVIIIYVYIQYDYCRHFLSSCKRILNLDFHTLPIDTGGATLAIHYLGRDVSIRVSHIGIRSNIIKNRVTLHYDELFNKIIQKIFGFI